MISCRQPFKRVERGLAGNGQPSTTREISRRMARVRRSGTEPELVVRRALSKLGIRYRLKNRDLPGNPDIANRARKFVVFVHGCFWHRHKGCIRSTTPKTNTSFWRAKFVKNVARDATAVKSLRRMGYRVVTLWECEVGNPRLISRRLAFVVGGSI